VEAANAVLKAFGDTFQAHWIEVFRAKLGLVTARDGDGDLVQGLLSAMEENEADFTRTFRALCNAAEGHDDDLLACFADPSKLREWLPKWNERLAEEGRSPADVATEMRGVNPWLIARNHRIEEAIAAANYGDFSFFEKLVEALEKPFEERPEFADYAIAPTAEQKVARTFCGT
jgi:uncharacterized protein YdiU (UPF0061 family)